MTTPTEDELLPEEPITRRRERITEERFEPGDTAAGAQVVVTVVPQRYVVAGASNGLNISATVEVDASFAEELRELIGESTYVLRSGEAIFGECRVMSVGTKADADNVPRTMVGLKWSQDQLGLARRIDQYVGTALRAEFWLVQPQVWGAKA